MKSMAKQLVDAGRCGVYQLIGMPEEVERAAKDAGLAAFRIDIGAARDKKDFLALLAKALRFPNWFGGNWDALNDSLTDLDWLPATPGYVLVFENSDHFVRHKRDFDVAKAVLSSAAEYWKTEGRPFWALFEVPQDIKCDLPHWP